MEVFSNILLANPVWGDEHNHSHLPLVNIKVTIFPKKVEQMTFVTGTALYMGMLGSHKQYCASLPKNWAIGQTSCKLQLKRQRKNGNMKRQTNKMSQKLSTSPNQLKEH